MSRDTNFYYSFVVLPPSKRDAIIAVWDFCRAVDDAVDEGTESVGTASPDRRGAVAELTNWRQELERCFDRCEPSTRQGRRLRPCIERFRLPRQSFDDLIDGVEIGRASCRERVYVLV